MPDALVLGVEAEEEDARNLDDDDGAEDDVFLLPIPVLRTTRPDEEDDDATGVAGTAATRGATLCAITIMWTFSPTFVSSAETNATAAGGAARKKH